MGIIVSVYRDASTNYDCTNGGESSRFTKLTVVNVDGPAEPSDDAPAVKLVQGPSVGGQPNPILVPVSRLESGDWTMFGGNFGSTSDSRFCRAVEALGSYSGIVPIHDRVEW